MNSKNIIAITNTAGICFKCLKEHKGSGIHEIHIPSAGYGSYFDNLSTELKLCDSCYAETNSEWWKFESIPYTSKYRYDNEIHNYLNDFPLPGQELVWNKFAYGAGAPPMAMDSQDWIDFELGELSHAKCKEYGFYSPDEKTAYEERFPTCQWPMNKVYDDSIGCLCPFGAYGDRNQQARDDMSEECYKCKKYKKRESPIISVKEEDWGDLMTYIEYQMKRNDLEQKFGALELGIDN